MQGHAAVSSPDFCETLLLHTGCSWSNQSWNSPEVRAPCFPPQEVATRAMVINVQYVYFRGGIFCRLFHVPSAERTNQLTHSLGT